MKEMKIITNTGMIPVNMEHWLGQTEVLTASGSMQTPTPVVTPHREDWYEHRNRFGIKLLDFGS